MKVIVIGLVFVLTFSMCGTGFAETSTEQYEINSVSELMEKSMKINDGDLSDGMSLADITEPSVFEGYMDRIDGEISNIVEDSSTAVDFIAGEEIDDKKNTKTYRLSDGGKVEITEEVAIDKLATEGGGAVMSMALSSNPDAVNRYYYFPITITYTATQRIYHWAYPDSKMKLKTNFTIYRNSIKANWASTAGTSAWYPIELKGSHKIIDSVASRVGHDLNAQGDYYHYMAKAYQRHHTLISYVKWERNPTMNSRHVRMSFKHLR